VEETVDAVIGSTYGCAGERCMATSNLVLVGDTGTLLDRILERARSLRLGDGLDTKVQMGPVISAGHRERIAGYIQTGLDEGARLLLDGRNPKNPLLAHGFFIGPTLFDGVTPDMRIAREEIFGPVLSVLRAPDLARAVEMANRSEYGNGASLFTASGAAARYFREHIQCGMLGINSGVPAPMAFFSFGGRKQSFFGDLRAHGPDAVDFYTLKKTVIERWFGQDSVWGK